MTTFFMSLILCLTVIASVGLGVITTYALVAGILQAFGRTTQSESAPRPASFSFQTKATPAATSQSILSA